MCERLEKYDLKLLTEVNIYSTESVFSTGDAVSWCKIQNNSGADPIDPLGGGTHCARPPPPHTPKPPSSCPLPLHGLEGNENFNKEKALQYFPVKNPYMVYYEANIRPQFLIDR